MSFRATALSTLCAVVFFPVAVIGGALLSSTHTEARVLPPPPPSCRQVIAQYGTAGTWRAYYSARFLRNELRDFYERFGYEGCFRSRRTCEAWLYDIQSFAPDVRQIERCHRLG